MAVKDITQGFLPTGLADSIAAVEIIRLILAPNMLNFTPEERKKLFKLGYSGVPFADTIINLGTQHAASVPGDINFTKVKLVHNYRKDLMTLQNNMADVVELIDDLIMNCGVLEMGWCNRIYSNASDMAKRSDYPFTELVKEAGKRYVKAPRTGGTTFGIAGGVELKVGKVKTGELFVNNGTTVLKFAKSDELSGVVKLSEAITVEPGNSVKVPAGYTTIIVYNMSSDTEGSFSVRIRS